MNPPDPVLPALEGAGGMTSAGVEGYGALIGNPAAFAAEERSLTVLSLNPWLYIRADRMAGAISTSVASETERLPSGSLQMLSEQAADGGFGFGASGGIGYAGRGLGLGILGTADLLLLDRPGTLSGTSLSSPGHVGGSIQIVAGFAVPFEIGPVRLSLGGKIRPQVMIYAPLDADSAVSLLTLAGAEGSLFTESMLNAYMTADALYGWAFSVDVGILLDVGPVAIGVHMLDIADTLVFAEEGLLRNHLASLAAFQMPDSGTTNRETNYVIPMDLRVGLAYIPDLGEAAKYFRPRLYLEFGDIIHIIRSERSFLATVHAGFEATLLRFFILRAGFSQGYPTGGFGLEFPGFTLNASYSTIERGKTAREVPNRCISIEAAIRF